MPLYLFYSINISDKTKFSLSQLNSCFVDKLHLFVSKSFCFSENKLPKGFFSPLIEKNSLLGALLIYFRKRHIIHYNSSKTKLHPKKLSVILIWEHHLPRQHRIWMVMLLQRSLLICKESGPILRSQAELSKHERWGEKITTAVVNGDKPQVLKHRTRQTAAHPLQGLISVYTR